MPEPVSDSYDPEWGTAANGAGFAAGVLHQTIEEVKRRAESN